MSKIRRLKPGKQAPKADHKGKETPKTPNGYEKYRCEYKKKSILTKLSSDSGYPQQLYPLRGHSMPCDKNYLQENKQNLRNYFKDRIPHENYTVGALMKREQAFVHPHRVFEIKQMQFNMKNKMKIDLKQSFDGHVGSKAESFQKIDQNFVLNDRSKEMKQKYAANRDGILHYQTDNYRRGTQSHIQKRSKVLKKQAYDKVFGPDVSSLSRTTGFDKKSKVLTSPPRRKSNSLHYPFQSTQTHKTLKHLIGKMHDYKNKLQQNDDILKVPEIQMHNTHGEQTMLTLIQNMAKIYQERTIQQGTIKIDKIQDLQKLSKGYYQEMIKHKYQRLVKRKQLAYQTVYGGQESPIKGFNSVRDIDHYSQISDQGLEQDDDENQEIGRKYTALNAVKYRFQLLKRTLVKWAALFYIYRIPKQDIFIAFRLNRDPYSMQGSYAFFKCIKLGDLASVQIFLQNNRMFAYEVQFSYRTALSYAAYHDQTNIALQILKIGVNSDMKCEKGHTSLYYALMHKNTVLVRQLLQRGACPWSTSKNPYNQMLKQGENKQTLTILFNNARKIYLGMQIQPSIAMRKEYWQNNFLKINEKVRLQYPIMSD